MRNLTITVEEDVVRWVRIHAAQEGISVSRLVGRMLQEKMEAERDYELAMRRDMAVRPVALKARGSYPSREELYDRKVLR